MRHLLYLYTNKQYDSINFILEKKLCEHDDIITCSLVEYENEFLNYYIKITGYIVDTKLVNKFIDYIRPANRTNKSKHTAKSLEWLHANACGKYPNALFNKKTIISIIKNMADDAQILAWFHNFNHNHTCKCNIRLIYKIEKIAPTICSNKKSYQWWIKNNLDLNLNKMTIKLPTYDSIKTRNILLRHGCKMQYVGPNSKCLINEEDILWCKNNNILIDLSNDAIDYVLKNYQNFLKHYEIYDWLAYHKKKLNYCSARNN